MLDRCRNSLPQKLHGYEEVVFTAAALSAWGKDDGGRTVDDAVAATAFRCLLVAKWRLKLLFLLYLIAHASQRKGEEEEGGEAEEVVTIPHPPKTPETLDAEDKSM